METKVVFSDFLQRDSDGFCCILDNMPSHIINTYGIEKWQWESAADHVMQGEFELDKIFTDSEAESAIKVILDLIT